MNSSTKKILAQRMGISAGTLRRYLNHFWYEELKTAGYYKSQRIITNKQLKIIENLWGDIEKP